jgi:hypothetical protein
MTDRATSTTLAYVLTLGIATILVSGLIVAGSTFVEDRRELVIRQELEVIGEHITSNIDQVDRYVRAGNEVSTARVEQDLPNSVTGATYNVRLADSGDPTLYLNSTQPDVSVSVNVTTLTDIQESNAGGGAIVVECATNACDKIEINNG